MNIGWIIVAEGITNDSRNALTLVALNQSILPTPTLPVATKRAVLTHVVDVELPEGTPIQLSYSVASPSGRVLLAQSATLIAGPVAWPEIPATLDFPAEFLVNVTEFGRHAIRVEVEVFGEVAASAEEAFYVVETPAEGGDAP